MVVTVLRIPVTSLPSVRENFYIRFSMIRYALAFAILLVALPVALAQPTGSLRVGAARIDITPSLDAPLPMAGYPGREDGHKGIHDNLYVRAIVIDDGGSKAAIVVNDLVTMSNVQWSRMAERIAKELGTPRENILLAATHNHAGPSLSAPGESTPGGRYALRVDGAMLQAVKTATAALSPARISTGTGRANLNINRRALFWDGSWWLGFNPDGFSDKTVGVVKFEDASGKCLAVLVNYGVHGTSMGQENQIISGDNPGATSRYVEEHHPDRPIVVWTSGAAGDQAPVYDRSPKAFTGTMNMGRVLGDEVLRVAASLKGLPGARVRGVQSVIQCPGWKRMQERLGGKKYDFTDAGPVEIRLSVLMLGDTALAGVSGEVFSILGRQTKDASPANTTMMVTHCNGSSGYIANDEAYHQMSYEIQVTRLKPGCAESLIPSTIADMVRLLVR